MKKLILATSVCLGISLPAYADDMSWETTGKPVDICYAVQKNVRFLYNAWANDAKDTYREVKVYMKQNLEGQGPEKAKLMAIYQTTLPKIESGEFLPPKVETRYVGNNKLQQFAGAECFKAFTEK